MSGEEEEMATTTTEESLALVDHSLLVSSQDQADSSSPTGESEVKVEGETADEAQQQQQEPSSDKSEDGSTTNAEGHGDAEKEKVATAESADGQTEELEEPQVDVANEENAQAGEVNLTVNEGESTKEEVAEEKTVERAENAEENAPANEGIAKEGEVANEVNPGESVELTTNEEKEIETGEARTEKIDEPQQTLPSTTQPQVEDQKPAETTLAIEETKKESNESNPREPDSPADQQQQEQHQPDSTSEVPLEAVETQQQQQQEAVPSAANPTSETEKDEEKDEEEKQVISPLLSPRNPQHLGVMSSPRTLSPRALSPRATSSSSSEPSQTHGFLSPVPAPAPVFSLATSASSSPSSPLPSNPREEVLKGLGARRTMLMTRSHHQSYNDVYNRVASPQHKVGAFIGGWKLAGPSGSPSTLLSSATTTTTASPLPLHAYTTAEIYSSSLESSLSGATVESAVPERCVSPIDQTDGDTYYPTHYVSHPATPRLEIEGEDEEEFGDERENNRRKAKLGLSFELPPLRRSFSEPFFNSWEFYYPSFPALTNNSSNQRGEETDVGSSQRKGTAPIKPKQRAETQTPGSSSPKQRSFIKVPRKEGDTVWRAKREQQQASKSDSVNSSNSSDDAAGSLQSDQSIDNSCLVDATFSEASLTFSDDTTSEPTTPRGEESLGSDYMNEKDRRDTIDAIEVDRMLTEEEEKLITGAGNESIPAAVSTEKSLIFKNIDGKNTIVAGEIDALVSYLAPEDVLGTLPSIARFACYY